MYVFQSQETDTIQAFAWYGLTKNVYWLLMNEYCAHTVECHYMKLKNYESFNNILKINENLDEDKVQFTGKTFDSITLKSIEPNACLTEKEKELFSLNFSK